MKHWLLLLVAAYLLVRACLAFGNGLTALLESALR